MPYNRIKQARNRTRPRTLRVPLCVLYLRYHNPRRPDPCRLAARLGLVGINFAFGTAPVFFVFISFLFPSWCRGCNALRPAPAVMTLSLLGNYLGNSFRLSLLRMVAFFQEVIIFNETPEILYHCIQTRKTSLVIIDNVFMYLYM